KTAIAHRLGVSRRVIYYWLATGQVDRECEAPPRRTPITRVTKLAAYTAIIAERLATYPELSAVRLFDEVRAAGYSGGITQVRDYVARTRPRPEPEPVVRFETPPGHQAQVDFAEVRFPWGKRYALLVVLGYSRLMWLQFYTRQTMAVIIEDDREIGGKLLENAEFMRFAAHWEFRIRVCRPYRAKTTDEIEQ